MNLSSEDQLRLNVVVAQPLQAVRVDESRMCVHALTEKGEAKIQLNPSCNDEKYIRLIRQFLSTHYLGSPGGYPVYLRRWTRMGQARDDSLEKLLLIGEPEAVAAVVHASGLTDELARRAWWSSTNAENARRMLEKQNVVQGEMGAELAQFLIEFLPFEEHQKAIIDSVSLVLQPGLIDAAARAELWKRAKRKNSYYVGFMQQSPNDLPVESKPHQKWSALATELSNEINQGNELAALLDKIFSAKGQAFLQTANEALKKPNDQDVVVALLNAIGAYFNLTNVDSLSLRDMQSLNIYAESLYVENVASVKPIITMDASLDATLKALFCLALISEKLVDPIFGMSDAIGSVMRKKIVPVVSPIIEHIELLSDN